MRNWIAILFVPLLALVACSADPFRIATPDEKTIAVEVKGAVPYVADDPAIADITRNKITWVLGDAWVAGYFFQGDGIAPGNTPPKMPSGCVQRDFNQAFHLCKASFFGKEFTCHRKNGTFARDACYQYMVTLTKSGGKTPPLDPWIKSN